MAYDEALAGKIRTLLSAHPGYSERKMFGGIAFMLGGNMVCGIVREDLMVRVGAAAYDDAVSQPYARPMDFTGRPMKGMVYVSKPGFDGDLLASWVERGVGYAESLPTKR